jgi:hypothetical protein
MENNYIDLGYEFWDRGYMFRDSIKGETEALKLYRELCAEGTIENVKDFFEWMLQNRSEMIYDYREEEKSYREKNEPLIREFFAKNIEGKAWAEIEPETWEWYSDWHKDVFGYRPHGIVCGEYINPHI